MESEAMTTVQSGSGATGRLTFEKGSRPFPDTEAVGSSIVGAGKVAAGEMLADLHRSESDLRRFLHGLPGVDQVGADARAASLATRSIKTSAKLWALEMAVAMVDLTTLEGADTPGKVMSLCAKARRPDPGDPSVPSVAAVCIYPDLVPVAKRALAGSSVKVASVATAFPSGRASLEVKLADVRDAVKAGADEVDMVIDRGAFLSGRYGLVLEEVQAVKSACGEAHLKVILETGELVTYDNVRRAGYLSMHGGDAGRRRLHQDLDRQGQPGGDTSSGARDAGSRARLRRAHRGARRCEGCRWHPQREGCHQVPRHRERDRRRGLAGAVPVPFRGVEPPERPAQTALQAAEGLLCGE